MYNSGCAAGRITLSCWIAVLDEDGSMEGIIEVVVSPSEVGAEEEHGALFVGKVIGDVASFSRSKVGTEVLLTIGGNSIGGLYLFEGVLELLLDVPLLIF